MELNTPPPDDPREYVVIYAMILMTQAHCEYFYGKLSPTEFWFYPDYPTCDEKHHGTVSDEDNIPQELIRIATEHHPFVGFRVEMLFKELGLYGSVLPSPPET